ncbi:LysR family transcriptional regulator [Vibrio zhugei]|uniref:LysR family transcriptional regulator n=1 Tax=Vibrio zhugei TaxID=2479546 RepID=A0ABV7C3Q6_9VIBR|nr:LysR family transcriptional regulator [Vibrio zhugei]
MEFRHLKYFVTVAQLRHFTKAADQIGIAQPPLSQQIKKLEHELGVDLFKRLSRGVELTRAGEIFLTDAQNILADAQRAEARVRQVARGENTQVNIGFATSTSTCIPVLEKMAMIQSDGIHFNTAEMPMPELVSQLKNKQQDLAIMRVPCYASEPFERKNLLDDPFVAVIPANHVLAECHSLQLHQLKEQTLLLFPRETGPALYDALSALLSDAGIRIQPQFASPQLRTTIAMAQAGFGIAIVPYSLAEHLDNSAVIVSIEDMTLTSQIVVAWQASNLNPQALKVVAKLNAISKAERF